MARRRAANNTAAQLAFEVELWSAADLLRANIESAKCKHVVLCLIFLKHVSDAFEERRTQLVKLEDLHQRGSNKRSPTNASKCLARFCAREGERTRIPTSTLRF